MRLMPAEHRASVMRKVLPPGLGGSGTCIGGSSFSGDRDFEWT